MRLLIVVIAALAAVSQIVRAENELIFAKILNGKLIPIEFEPSSTVERLKEKIKEKEGIPQKEQQLIFDDKLLEDDKQLCEYGLVAGSIVTLLIYQKDAGAQKIFIEDPIFGTITPVLFKPNTTVASFQNRDRLGGPEPIRGWVYIFFRDKQLEDDKKTLADYNIGPWSTLTATLRYGRPFRKIIVKVSGVKTFVIDVETGDTVASIKNKIWLVKGIPSEQQHLIFSDKQRENDNNLVDDLDMDKWPFVTLESRPAPGTKQFVCVKTLANKMICLEVGLSDKVSNLKALIEHKTHISPHLQQLVFRGKLLLDDEKQLSDHDIAAWSTLTLIVRPRDNPSEKVIIKTLTNRSIIINIDLRDTVSILKDKIKQKVGVSQCLQRLVYDHKQLEDNELLSAYDIQDGSTVYMVLYHKHVES